MPKELYPDPSAYPKPEKNKLTTPKFLTREVAEKAVHYVMQVAYNMGPILPSALNCHVVVIVPSKNAEQDKPEDDWVSTPMIPYVLYEISFGDPETWSYDYVGIARCKAKQLLDGRNDGGTDVLAHLLFPGDAPWFGGVKREGIVVGISGFHSHIDRMLSGAVADICIGMAYNGWYILREAGFNESFLPAGARA